MENKSFYEVFDDTFFALNTMNKYCTPAEIESLSEYKDLFLQC